MCYCNWQISKYIYDFFKTKDETKLKAFTELPALVAVAGRVLRLLLVCYRSFFISQINRLTL